MFGGFGNSLRVFNPEEAGEGDFSLCTLREFFERWYLEKILNDPIERERPAAVATILLYREAIGWWEKLTSNPRAGEICDADAATFVEGLSKATYRRSPFGADRLLSASTRAKHVASIRALLSRLVDDGRGAAVKVLEKRVRLRKQRVDSLPKPTPPLATFLDIVQRLRTDSALTRLVIPAPSGSRPNLWWRALLGTLYCHGWRLNTALALKKDMIALEDITRIRVPGDVVSKTHKAAIRPVPDWLRELWAEAHVAGPFVLGKPATDRWLLEGWRKIQRKCGITVDYSLHSLRRLHSVEVGKTGFHDAEGLSRDSLQHSDAATTRSHYANLLEFAILKLRPVA
jgi:integrase